MNYLCDTNVISEVMKRSPNPKVELWLSQQDSVSLSVISVEEIYFGLTYKDAQRQLEWFEEFLQTRAEILPVTLAIAKRAGTLRGGFRKRGITKTQADLLIAATASVLDLTLSTRNVRDFEECDIRLFNPFED